jgi:hypothetical protein
LKAYRRYDLTMEYYENGGSASARLLWSSSSVPKSVIPQTQLYSGAMAPMPLQFQSIARQSNAMHFTLTGTPGDVIRLEASTNLSSWQTIATLTNIIGVMSFVDPQADVSNRRFYRLNARPP